MTRKVAVVGSTGFPITAAVGAEIVELLRDLGDAAVLTRGALGFEQFVGTACLILGVRCFTFAGQGSNWARDEELAGACDEVLAFLDPAVIDNPKTGTAHLIECALAAGKAVRAATVVGDNLVWADDEAVG